MIRLQRPVSSRRKNYYDSDSSSTCVEIYVESPLASLFSGTPFSLTFPVSLPKAFLFLFFVGIVVGASAQVKDSATLYYTEGTRYADSYKLDTAIALLEKARALFNARSPQGSVEEAAAAQRLADIYKYDLYDFDKAEGIYEHALAVVMEFSPADTRRLSRIYYSLATTNRSQRDYETAISWCLKGVNAGMAIKDYPFLERAYQILGNIYRDMHRYDSAVVYYQKCVDVNYEINKGKENETLAGLYSGWGDTNYKQGDLNAAAKRLSSSVAICQKIGKVDKSIYMYTVRLLAEVYVKMNDLKKAWMYLQLADQIRKELALESGGPVSNLFINYGDYYSATGDTLTSKKYYQRALQATTREPLGTNGNPTDIDKVEFKNFAYEALLAKARLLKGDSVIICYSIAEKLMVASRGELDTEDAKWNYVDANFNLYENALATLFNANSPDHNEDILHFVEASKSKSLADALQEVELAKNDTLLAKLRNLRQYALSLQHEIDQNNNTSTRDQLIKTTQDIAAVEASINTLYPSYLQARYENVTTPLSDLRKKVRSLDAAFVEYFWGYDRIYALVISGDTTKFYHLGSPAEIEPLIAALSKHLTSKANLFTPADVEKFSATSFSLYRKLIQPFENIPLGKKRLIIVPDGPLMQVPFETLVTRFESGATYNRLNYLINDYIISYGFSGSYFVNSRKPPARKPSMIAFGFTGGSDVRSPDAARPDIAGSETELIALSEKFPNGTFMFGPTVTEENFKHEASNYDLIHLAVHGSGDVGKDYSATLYFRDQQGPEDGKLYWYELYGMNLKASLAVLSSCESGIGKTYRGEGMLSMANAFTFAGCSNVVMGLWKVDDQVSVKLMDTFYSELLQGVAIDEALAKAKRTYLSSADQVSANPKLWGSLVAYGEAEVITPDRVSVWWVVLAMIVLVLGIIVLARKIKRNIR